MKTIHKELFKSTALIKLVLFLFLGLSNSVQLKSQSSYTITNIGNTFDPDTLYCNVGDSINFSLTNSHNAVEVLSSTWLASQTTALPNGFSLPFGGGTFIPDSAQTYWYICTPHASMGMKAVIIACDLSVSYTSTDATDSSACDGVISFQIAGGVAPFTESWTGPTSITNNALSPISNLCAGTYVHNVVDSEGCISQDTVEVLVNNCFATLGQIGSCDSIQLTSSASSTFPGPYNYNYYLYFDGILIDSIINTIDGNVTFPNYVIEGWYNLEVINTTTGCESADSMLIDFNQMSIDVLAHNNVSDPGACDGFIAIEVLGGAYPWTITWTNTSGDTISGPTQPFNTSNISTLCENTYCIDVTDVNGCTIDTCFDIIFSSCNTSLTITDSIECNGELTGEITATIDTTGGGVGTNAFINRYTYTVFSLNPTTQIGSFSTNDTFYVQSGLGAGSYRVDVIDSSYISPFSCLSDSIELIQPDPIIFWTTVDSTSAPSIADGVITIDSITGGTQPYIVTWLDSVGLPLPTSGILVQDSLGYSNQYNGGYTIYITDTNGCEGSDIIYVHPNNASANLSVDSVGIDHVSCYGACDGRLYMKPYDVGPSSVASFVYIWIDVDGSMPGLNPGDTMRVDSVNSPSGQYNGAPSHVATYTNRCAGTYNLFAFDYYGNPFPSGFFPITFTVNQPDSIGIDLGPDIIIDCGEDTVLSAQAFGGTKTNDTTLVNSFVLDFNNPSGIGDTLVTGGNYLLVVSGTFRHDTSSVDHLDAAYDYSVIPSSETMLWNFDGTNIHRPSPNIYQTSHTYSFPFIATNNGGIPGMGVHTWSIPSSNYTGQLSCNLYAIDTGVYIYNYNWTSIPPSFPAIISDEDTCYMNPGITNPGPAQADYIVTVTDINGCPASDTVNVMWDLYILNFDQINTTDVVPCYGDAAGTINVSVDSSTGFNPYTYSVLDQTGVPINFAPASDTTFNLIAGDYVLFLEDNLGCLSENDTITINQPDSIWACGVGNLNSQFLIDNFVMDFDTISTAFNHTSPIQTLFGVNYLLVVNGTYGLDFFNSNHKDPAFIIASGTAVNDWTVNGATIRPDVDVYSNTHQYSYTFAGDGNATSFGFIDPNGTYNNNAGSLTFTLYKLGCANTDTVYTCSDDSTGYSSISAIGGAPFDPDGIANSGDEYYNYEWTDDASGTIWSTADTVGGLPAGDYTVNIIDANGCSEYERYLKVLEAPTPLQIDSINVLDILCFGNQTAKMTAYFSGGYGPYKTVLIHDGVTTVYQSINDIDSVTINNLTYGSYILYVYDSLPDDLNGDYFCEQTVSFTITQPQSPLSSTVNLLLDVSCWGDSTGKARVIASGGNSLSLPSEPYSYLWDNGETTAIADSLWADVNLAWPSPQWHGVTITDSNGCTHRDSIQIQHLNEEIQAYNTLDGSNTVQVIRDVQCFNACDAIVTISSIGGSSNIHTYTWDIGHVGFFQPDTVTGLCAGGHDIIIEDQVGCRKTVYYQISQPDELFANAQVVDYWSYNGVNSPTGHVQCFGFDNGVAHTTATGGTHPYIFVWDSLSLNPNTSITDSINNWSIDSIHSGQINDTAGVMNGPNFGLTPGIHIGYVIDKNGCLASDTVMITEPDPLTVVIQDTSTVYSYCTGTNSAYLYSIASGGIEPYNYVWSDPLGQTTQWADDLMAGTYTVVVLDDNGCSASDTRVIDSVTNSMDASTAVTNISCFGLFDGSTLVDNVWGAVPLTNTGNLAVDYDYSWTGPNGYTASQQQINFLYAGNYGVTITDSNNCSITIYTDVQEPDLLSYTLYDITGETCYGSCNGSISVDVNGGTSPYYWDGDMLGNSPFTNPISLVNDSLILDLCNGDYDIYVTDENDCIGTVVWGGVWQATIDSGFVVSVSAPNITQSPSCYNSNDGHANVFWWDQNPLFTYTWETLNGDVVDIGTHTTILSGGDYNLVAHYADSANFGQVYTACDATVQFNMPSPSQILANESIVTIACYGDANGSISLVPSGGSGSNYTYQWDTTTSVPNGSTNSSINGLQEATYTVTITDGDGCTETIDYPLIEPDPLTNDFNPIVNASCNGDNDGSIKANISGGTPIYSYSWSPSGGNNQTANSLTAGNYTVTVTDSRSCTESFDITITEPDAIISGVEPNAFYGNDATGTISYNISCNGLSDGSAIVNLGGGTAPYTFSWTTGGFDQLETGMPAGTHTVTVTDNQGCYEDMDITLVEPDLLIVNGTSTGNYTPFPGGFDISCKGLNDGECYADPTGGVPGTPGYMYSWSGPIGGQISNLDEITNLYVGTYSITVTDANECTTSQTFILTEPTDYFIAETHLVNYAGAAVSPVTADFQDNTISVDQYDYTFYWPIGDSIDVINVTNLTDFQELSFMEIGENEVYIKVQNMNSGCIDDTTFIIEVQGIPDIHNVFTPNGDGTNDYFDFGEFAMKEIDVSIYNRWGEMVINWQDSNHQWDGRGIDGQDLPEGVYYYVLIATGEDGYDYQKKGSITLLR